MLLHVLTPYLLRRGLDRIEKYLRSQNSQEIPLDTRDFLLKSIPVVRSFVLYGHRLHMAVFYLRGIFYHIAKRISGVQYVSPTLYHSVFTTKIYNVQEHSVYIVSKRLS